MRFDVIPAIDVKGGAVASMSRGDPSTLVAHPGDPVALARALVGEGARWIHVVDLDAALTGRPDNLDLVAAIAGLPVRVQVGGGLDPDGVRAALTHRAARAILGTRALADLPAAEAAIREAPSRVGVGLDVKDHRLAPRGGGDGALAPPAAMAWIRHTRPGFVVYTAVDRDGTMQGPDLEGLARVAEATTVPVVASGGIRSLDDLAIVAAIGPAVVGAIVGRALREGAFTLGEALETAAEVTGR